MGGAAANSLAARRCTPLTLGVGSVAAFVGLSEAWGDGAAFACVPGGYDG